MAHHHGCLLASSPTAGAAVATGAGRRGVGEATSGRSWLLLLASLVLAVSGFILVIAGIEAIPVVLMPAHNAQVDALAAERSSPAGTGRDSERPSAASLGYMMTDSTVSRRQHSPCSLKSPRVANTAPCQHREPYAARRPGPDPAVVSEGWGLRRALADMAAYQRRAGKDSQDPYPMADLPPALRQ